MTIYIVVRATRRRPSRRAKHLSNSSFYPWHTSQYRWTGLTNFYREQRWLTTSEANYPTGRAVVATSASLTRSTSLPAANYPQLAHQIKPLRLFLIAIWLYFDVLLSWASRARKRVGSLGDRLMMRFDCVSYIGSYKQIITQRSKSVDKSPMRLIICHGECKQLYKLQIVWMNVICVLKTRYIYSIRNLWIKYECSYVSMRDFMINGCTL